MSSMKEMIHDILKVTAETSKKVEEAVVTKSSFCSSRQGDSSCVTTVNLPATTLTCSDVVRDAPSHPGDDDWSIANRAKRGKPPASRPTAGSSAAAPGAAAVPTGATSVRPPKSAKSAAVIGARKSGSIKAVAAVRRFSMFMSRLPPGTGEDAVCSYVREQSGADTVTAEKLPTRFDSYESYRIEVVNASADVDLLDPQLWAQGLVVRRFFQKRRTVGSVSGEQRMG